MSFRTQFTNLSDMKAHIVEQARKIGLCDEKGAPTLPSNVTELDQLTQEHLGQIKAFLTIDLTAIIESADELIDQVGEYKDSQNVFDQFYFFKKTTVTEDQVQTYKKAYLGDPQHSDRAYLAKHDIDFFTIKKLRENFCLREMLDCIRPHKIQKLKNRFAIHSDGDVCVGFDALAEQAAEEAAAAEFFAWALEKETEAERLDQKVESKYFLPAMAYSLVCSLRILAECFKDLADTCNLESISTWGTVVAKLERFLKVIESVGMQMNAIRLELSSQVVVESRERAESLEKQATQDLKPTATSKTNIVLETPRKYRKIFLYMSAGVVFAALTVMTGGFFAAGAIAGIGLAFAALTGSATATITSVAIGAGLTTVVGAAFGLSIYKLSLGGKRGKVGRLSVEIPSDDKGGCNPLACFYRTKTPAVQPEAKAVQDFRCYPSPLHKKPAITLTPSCEPSIDSTLRLSLTETKQKI